MSTKLSEEYLECKKCLKGSMVAALWDYSEEGVGLAMQVLIQSPGM
jgi:hypothetical protein